MSVRRGLVLPALAVLALVAAACSAGSGAAPRPSGSTFPPPTRRAVDIPPADIDGEVYAHTGVGQLSPAVRGVPTRVYVPNSEANTVDVIDPATFKVVDHYPVGRLPQHVTPSWDLKTLYADNNLGNTLTPIDPRSGKPGPPIPVDDPYNLYFTPDGSKAIVVAERLERLDFRDPHTWKLLASVPVSHKGVDHADFSADGTEMVVSCEFSGWLVRVDVQRMAVTGELNVGGSPVDVKLSPDGSVYYVANQKRNGVSVINADTLHEDKFIPTGKGAHGLYTSRDARFLYVSNRGQGTVSVLDVSTQQVVATWHTGGSPDMGGVSSDGTQLWLTGRYNGEVYVIDTGNGRLLHRIKVGAGPHGLSIFPQPGRYSLGHTGVFR